MNDPDDTRWLHSLIWPEHHQRTKRLDAALTIARADPPHLIQGDLNQRLPDAIAQAPPPAPSSSSTPSSSAT
ncbi:DUF2332 family protein [Nocardiopsis gilva]|uniref:DUF2332 family protein n=1 Tax=Nocardiopsis gilva TaxID=280236 RepID=UPI003742C124